MPRDPGTPSPLRSFLRHLWLTPLLSVLFAVFFGTLYGGGWAAYRGAYLVALVFGYSVSLGIWALEAFGLPRLMRPTRTGRKPPPWVHIAWYGGVSMFGSVVGAIIVHFTLIPGLLGNLRSILMLAMFTVIFCGLFLGT